VAKPAQSRPAVSGKTSLKVVHISDIHVDLSYTVGANYNCTKNICCRPYTTSDDVGVTAFPAGEYGSVYCDSPLSLEESMYAAIESLVPDAAFTIFTGDVVEGAVWLVTDSEVQNDLDSAYNKMSSLNLVYGVVGNHDAAPVNSFPPPTIDTTISSQYVYDTLASLWTTWIGSTEAKASDSNEGSYSVLYPGGNLRVISVNTNFWYKQNFWLYEKTMEKDPAGLFAWLVTELQAAETNGERVFLMGHMPMGRPDAFHDASNYFNQIIQRYEATISACFFGHTHKDEFEIAYSDYTAQTAENAVMNSYIAPALTPTSGNPTFRVYDVDPVTFGILDYVTYYTNISSPTYQSGPVWEKLYSVKESYGPLVTPAVTDASAELTPAFWHSLTELFETDDAVFQQYYRRKARDYDPSTSCTGTCKTDEICDLRSANSEYNCDTVSLGVNFKRSMGFQRRDEDFAHSENDLCHGSKMVAILSAVAGNLEILEEKLTSLLGADFVNSAANYTVQANGTLVMSSKKV
jgi:sphingomyelin phosphodiesterase